MKEDISVRKVKLFVSREPKAWANASLRLAIQQVYNAGRDLSARRLEVFYWLDELRSNGFEWQAERLENHIHLAEKRGVFSFTASKEADPQDGEEASS